MFFAKHNVTDFVRRWNIECEDYGITDAQKCARIIDYCSSDIREVVEMCDGYIEKDWPKLQTELKTLYWQYDQQKGTTTALNQLIRDAPSLDLNIFVLRYTSISAALVKAGALSALDRIGRLLDGLSPHLRDKALEYCTKEDWRLSSHDTGTKEPDFDKLKDFILTKAQTA